MWCKDCMRETTAKTCEQCGKPTLDDVSVGVYWCEDCMTPIIQEQNHLLPCPLCQKKLRYLAADLRPVFPEERLLVEILIAKPLEFLQKSVWAVNNRYYIDGISRVVPMSKFKVLDVYDIVDTLEKYQEENSYDFFNQSMKKFVEANGTRLNYLTFEAFDFIQKTAEDYPEENVVISFSGGKDSTVTADLTVRALSNPSLVHIYGDTTLEFPHTTEYVKRFRKDNPKAILKTAKNKEQDFMKVCEDIGPPARMLRWCCSMMKTGPITRVLNNFYRNTNILTFYGIRKCESVSRSKYNRVEDDAEAVKIQKQKVASPIFFWQDIDIWLYILREEIDFNDAYRLGYDRVGCWCCPNNNHRAIFLSRIYMPEQSEQWRDFLIDFAKRIGKPDPETYVDEGKWKARQGGNGLSSAEDVKIKFSNCTAEENAKIYQLNSPVDEDFIGLFCVFGTISKELGRKLLKEVLILDRKTKVPIISIQPFQQSDYDYAVKIQTLNVAKHQDLQRMIGYQVKKSNACRKCLKCESLCKFGAITMTKEHYRINPEKCVGCKMCVTNKFLDGGCLMEKYLKTKKE